ncbi:hypothetical protein BH09PSE3_BH09PSE3_09420 [soil metagenome]
MVVPPLSPDEALPALRREMRKLRQDLDKKQVWQPSFLPEPIIRIISESDVIGLYAPMSGEPDPFAIPMPHGTTTALPALLNDGQIIFRHWKPGDLQVLSLWKGRQPPETAKTVEPDVIFVPLVAFDLDFNRLGQGGGHYDRYFAAHPTARRIGVAWEAQRVVALPLRPWDMPLDAVITEQSCYLKDFPDA